jgi:hypothetical protein
MPVHELEVHYFLKDGQHALDAFMRNKCEAELLATLRYLADQFGCTIVLEARVPTEGGFREHWQFLLKPENAAATAAVVGVATVLASIAQVIVAIWVAPPKPDADLEAKQKQLIELTIIEKQLSNQKLTLELAKLQAPAAPPPSEAAATTARTLPPADPPSSPAPPWAPVQRPGGIPSVDEVINSFNASDRSPRVPTSDTKPGPRLQMDPRVSKRRSNFYKQLMNSDAVTSVDFTLREQRDGAFIQMAEWGVPRNNFATYLLFSDKLPTEVDEAVIEIIAPVLAEGDLNWRGVWKGESISFALKDKVFKERVLRREVSFQSGHRIRCILETDRKLDETGESKLIGHSVTTVLDLIEAGGKVTETPQGRAHRFNKRHRHAQDDLFKPTDT